MKKIILICLIFLMLGCMANRIKKMNSIMDSWMGTHKSDLIRAWGPPTRYDSDGKGGEILIYEYRAGYQLPGTAYIGQNGNLYYTNPTQINRDVYRMFYVNEKGKIYYWRWQGL